MTSNSDRSPSAGAGDAGRIESDDAAETGSTNDRTKRDRERLSVVESYANTVLETGRDRWSGEDTPLLADGVHVDTHEPVTWRHDGEEFVISNLASQQNLFRVLTGLSALTGDSTYEDAARAAIRYHFDNLVDESGLLRWGGHQFIDLATLEPVGRFDSDVHEFKNHFPFYELLWAVDVEKTRRFLRAVWNAHVLDWSTLDMNRHGEYDQSTGDLWENEFDDPEPFYAGDGLSFINIGSDLIHAAGALYALGDESGAWAWGERLAGMYVKARHPETGLGAYQYTKPRRRDQPPAEGPLPTTSNYGDRAENQFGDQFGDVAREGWALWGGKIHTIYVQNALMQLHLAEKLGADGALLQRWTADGLDALAEYAYTPTKNAFRPLWADGTDLTGCSFDRSGYYGDKGQTWRPLDAGMDFLLTYARAYRVTGRSSLWNTARQLADGLEIGDIGESPESEPDLDMDVPGDSPEEVFALLELYQSSRQPAYLERARLVADRMVDRRYHHGYFLPSQNHVYARFDAIEPLAVLALDATIRGEPDSVPEYVGGSGYVHGQYDGHGRTRDTRVIWPVTREETSE